MIRGEKSDSDSFIFGTTRSTGGEKNHVNRDKMRMMRRRRTERKKVKRKKKRRKKRKIMTKKKKKKIEGSAGEIRKRRVVETGVLAARALVHRCA